jgi:hypothetical protein
MFLLLRIRTILTVMAATPSFGFEILDFMSERLHHNL